MEYTILIAEDDRDISALLKLYLESNGYKTILVENGAKAYEAVKINPIHMAIVDIMMPEMDGYALTRKIRDEGYRFPIMFLSAKTEDNDKILGLNLGADDYMTKPFNPLEIIARVNSNLRREYQLNKETQESRTELENGQLCVNTEKMTAVLNGQTLNLTPTEFKILALLMKHPGHVYTKAQICEAVNGEFYESDENAIIVHISKLREKLGDSSKNPEYIRNIRGLGYKIEKK
ncbi:MAG: response regulator transcription factor [Emergencia sp.]|nr:response regulator transcription factor [Emergencia sp.]